MKQGTNLGSQIGRWIILAAVVALLGTLLLTIRPVGAQDAPPVPDPIESKTIEVPENTVAVSKFTARDIDMGDRKIFWTLGGADAAKFKIKDGVLEFKKAPNYEARASSSGDNAYAVTVRMSSGGEHGVDLVADDRQSGNDVTEIEVTVNVINVKEPGSVVLYPRQPQIGSTLRAYHADPDGSATRGSWQWASSNSMSGPFTDIPALSTDSAYRPTADDLGKYLRVTVKYVDAAGGTPEDPNEAMVVSTLKVREDTVTSNDAPKFPDQRTLGIMFATSPAETVAARRLTERFVVENSPAGTKVGAPVTAIDDAHRIDKLGYSLSDGTGTPGDAGKFRIDVKTGQITVAARLNADVEDTTYDVKVTAIDGDEDSASINVTIRVLDQNEGPTIRSTYPVGVPTATTGHSNDDRVPTEMSHPEADRRSSEHQAVRNTLQDADDTDPPNIGERNALKIDTDLDDGIEDIDIDGTTGMHDAAVYYASDQDGGTETAELAWSLEGDDGWLFYITDHAAGDGDFDDTSIADFDAATLSFKTKEQLTKTHPKSPVLDDYPNFPDHENARDKNRDNVYEVTLVVTDQNSGLRAEFPVTVKVINSGEDNEPGKVRILNRQPEIGVELVAELTDTDTPITRVNWQWYRAVEGEDTQGFACTPRDPFDADTTTYDGFRYFLDDAPGLAIPVWVAISGAKGTGTTAKYTPDYKGAGATSAPHDSVANAVVWTGGDIKVRVTTDTAATPHTVTYSDWMDPKCLRVAFTYEDAVNRTFQGTDTNANDVVNQILEGAFVGSEFSVKRHDLNNNKPQFIDPDDSTVTVLTYPVTKAENASGADRAFLTTTEVLPAVDLATEEDDSTDATPPGGLGNDTLTYSLSGADAKYFVIVGSVDHPTSYDTTPDVDEADVSGDADNTLDAQGQLSFKHDTHLNYDRPDGKRDYVVIITATDPSGDKGSSSVEVNVNITDHNERPAWVPPIMDGRKVRYEENGTDPVFLFIAKNPETPNRGPGISYALVTATVSAGNADSGVEITDADIADRARFSVNSLTGALSFSSPPDYETPGDVGEDPAVAGDNMYQVAVMAVAADPVTVLPMDADERVRITTVYRKITVIVTNVNEAPVFSDESFTLRIRENIDDLHKEPTQERGPLYLLNRGVGIPGTNLPAAPHLDVGTPVLAGDDDSTATFPIGGPGNAIQDMVDGLTYELMGSADALETFTIVPATGQILSQKKLDHEKTSSYKVTVKATDPWKAYDTIALTIDVTNEEEQPIPKRLIMSGANSYSHEENSEDDLGEYTVSATGGASASPRWTLEGADAEYFDVAPKTGAKVMLKFKAAPDYETKADADGDNVYAVTLKVTDPSDSTVVDDLSVKVTVTDVDELGTLTGDASASNAEGMEDVGTYTLTGTAADTADWSVGGADADDFTLAMVEGSDASRMLKFRSAPDYETPMGGAANDSNTYMVSVQAEADGEMDMVEVTVTVTNVDELGALSGSTTNVSVNEGDTDALGTYTLTGTAADTADWSLDETGTSDFMLEGTGMSRMLKFESAPDYETPMGGANDDSNTYMVTVMASAGGEMEMVAVTITVDNVKEAGAVTLNPTRPSVGTPITASLEDSDIVEGTVSWQWASADAMDGDFEDITGADSDTYTPAAADAGMYLMATATYTDALGSDSANMVSSAAVSQLAVNGEPEVEHPENSTNVATYTASGADSVQWSLSGDDAADFNIRGGQLTFRTSPDYEDPADADMDNVYMVTVGARAGTLMASQDVAVTVSNVDELGTLAGDGSLTYAEGGTAAVGTYMVSGGDGSTTINWSLDGADASQFMLDGTGMSRMLNFRSAPDYESPMGGANDDSNIYMVTVKAEAGGEMAMQEVTVMVTNMEEDGTVTLDPARPSVGSEVTATLTDLDGGITGTTWQWSKSMTMNGTFTDIGTATSASYTTVEDDTGMYLQATATYTDGHGPGKMATSEAVMISVDMVSGYDTNDDGDISIAELFVAIDDYFDGGISIAELFEVIDAYFE